MTLMMALLVGVLYAVGVYLLLRRNIVRVVFGLVVLGHAANLLIFTAGGLVRAGAPLAEVGAAAPPPGSGDPVPQALVLTAIVIGFAVVSFAAVLVKRAVRALGTDDADELRTTG